MDFKKKNLIISLMLAMFLAAVEGTIVTMATPTIARELHGFTWISLVFSVYLLTSAISTPVYGKLADLYGRKRMLSVGILIFLSGSCLCGFAQNMVMLIVCRGLQGLGAGSIFTISYTIIGDVFTVEERSKVQGGLNAVWGVAGLVGPFLGGFLIDVLSWHWIFFINIPFGLLSVILLQGSLQETYEKKKHSMDFAGTAALSLAVMLFLSIFLFDQSAIPAYRWIVALSLVLTVLLLYGFYKIERKAKEPIISFGIFTRVTVFVSLISFLVYAVLIGIDVYMPIYLQNILGYRPTISGLALLPMSIAWLMTSFILGKSLMKYGGKAVTVGATAVILLGAALLITLGVDSPLILVVIYEFVLGIGFGGVSTTLTIVVQESVDYCERGSAVGANSLLRTLGQTVGISVFGSIFNRGITNYFAAQGIADVNPTDLYQSAASSFSLSANQVRLALNDSLRVLFFWLIAICCFSLLLASVMPKIKKLH